MSHIIKSVTLTGTGTNENLATLLGVSGSKRLCAWFAVQNRDTANPVYLSTDAATAAADSVEIEGGSYKLVSPLAANNYNLESYWLRPGIAGQKVVIEFKRL